MRHAVAFRSPSTPTAAPAGRGLFAVALYVVVALIRRGSPPGAAGE